MAEATTSFLKRCWRRAVSAISRSVSISTRTSRVTLAAMTSTVPIRALEGTLTGGSRPTFVDVTRCGGLVAPDALGRLAFATNARRSHRRSRAGRGLASPQNRSTNRHVYKSTNRQVDKSTAVHKSASGCGDKSPSKRINRFCSEKLRPPHAPLASVKASEREERANGKRCGRREDRRGEPEGEGEREAGGGGADGGEPCDARSRTSGCPALGHPLARCCRPVGLQLGGLRVEP